MSEGSPNEGGSDEAMRVSGNPGADPETYVGIDLGGTKLFGALVDAGGATREESYVEHGAASSGEALDLTAQERALGPAYARLAARTSELPSAAICPMWTVCPTARRSSCHSPT